MECADLGYCWRTPIAYICGFAALMCGESLTRRKRRQVFCGYAADSRHSRYKDKKAELTERQSHSAQQSGEAATKTLFQMETLLKKQEAATLCYRGFIESFTD